MRTRVKICGITQKQDALACVEAGADAIGLVFYEASPRAVTIEQAAEIVSGLPAFVTTVGLFVDADASYVNEVLAGVNLDCLQFHGDETAEYCEQFNRAYYKAVRMQQQTDLKQVATDYASARALLLDTFVANVPGGTGQTFNWELVPSDFAKPLILAGGLSPDNVAQAIKATQPYAVDVSGGVEKTKGVKDIEMIKQFLKEVQCIGTDN